MRKLIIWSICFLIGIGFGYLAFGRAQLSENGGEVGGVQEISAQSATLIVDFGEGQVDRFEIDSLSSFTTALDLLRDYGDKQDVGLDIQESSFGEFIDGIGDKKGDESHFWSFWVNGEMATVGAAAYEVKDGDVVEFKWTEM